MSIFGTLIVAVSLFILWPILLGFGRFIGFFTLVREQEARVYVLFGNVVGVITEPGLHFLWFKLGWQALFVNNIGQSYEIDMRFDQEYLRSQPVNSEEGAPMGIGIWYEMFISDPVSFIFRNADPRGSLRTNVSNTTVRCLSNMKLPSMLENRHTMSKAVRDEVTGQSKEWGYKVGSVYIRKVHFRDPGMINQIEEKVVNRLRQVTSAIKQDGANQVKIITSSAERQAAVEFAKAQAIRPRIVGEALQKIYLDPEVGETLFEILELKNVIESNADVSLIPINSGAALVSELMNDRHASAKRAQ